MTPGQLRRKPARWQSRAMVIPMSDAAAAPPSRLPRTPLVRRTRALLIREGFRPDLLPGDPQFPVLYFRDEGARYYLQFDADDSDFVQVSMACELPKARRPDELTALRIAHSLQGSTKLVKVWLGPGASFVEFQAPLFLGGHRFGPELLRRCIGVVRHAAGDFWNRLLLVNPSARA